MGTTTFTGPVRAGSILNTTGTTPGTDMANVGYAVMSQSAAFTQATNISSAGVYKTSIVVPAGSRIVSIIATVTTAWSGVATTINVGTISGGTAGNILATSARRTSRFTRSPQTPAPASALSPLITFRPST